MRVLSSMGRNVDDSCACLARLLTSSHRVALYYFYIYYTGIFFIVLVALFVLTRAELTGVTPQILAANNALTFREVWPQFASWLTGVSAEAVEAGGDSGVVLVAHNAKFDHKFLVEEQARGGFDR